MGGADDNCLGAAFDTSPKPAMNINLSLGHNTGMAALDANSWTQILNAYRKPSHARSVVELAITVLPLAGLWVAGWFTYSVGYAWASLLIAVPAAGFLLRLFMIQHDCGH